MTLKLFQYLDDNINSAPPKYQSCSFKTVGVVWIQRSKMAVILYIYIDKRNCFQKRASFRFDLLCRHLATSFLMTFRRQITRNMRKASLRLSSTKGSHPCSNLKNLTTLQITHQRENHWKPSRLGQISSSNLMVSEEKVKSVTNHTGSQLH